MDEVSQDVDDGYSLRRVPQHQASSDLFTPFAPPRQTQSSLGYYLVKNRTEEDLSFGVHKAVYGGIGAESCSGGALANVPRRHQHLRTGLDESIPPRVKEHNRKYIVAYNRGLYASPPPDVGDLMFSTHLKTHVDHDFKKVTKSIFPRPVVFELDYIKNEYRKKMLLALEKERAEFEEKVKRKRELNEHHSQEQATNMSKSKSGCPVKDKTSESCNIQPPFWWPDKGDKRDFKSTAITIQDDHPSASPTDPNFGTVDVKREMKLDDPNEYQPGQVYKQRKDDTDGGASVASKSQSGWVPKDPNFYKQFDPSSLRMTSPLYETVKQRQVPLPESVKLSELSAGANQTCNCKCHEREEDERLGMIVTSSAYRQLKPVSGGCAQKVRCEICQCEIAAKMGELETLRPKDAIELLDRIDDNRRELAGRHLKGIKGSKPHPFPGESVRYGVWDDSRQMELAKVGLPFKTEAARWMEKNMDPLELNRIEKASVPWNITNL